jgi:hypothetical protein
VRDVTIYPLQLEPASRVERAAFPPVVPPGQLLPIHCANDGVMSGLVWRRDDPAKRELRVVAASPTRPGKELLDPPDLDCDKHSPGRGAIPRRDAGDQRDCDDTAAAIHGDAREVCATPMIDEDCSPGRAPMACSPGITCPNDTCVCVDSGQQLEICAPPAAQACRLPAQESPGGLKPCTSTGNVRLAACAAGCAATLVVVPSGLEVTISDDEGQMRSGPGVPVQTADDTVHLAIQSTRAFMAEVVPEPIIIRVDPMIGAPLGEAIQVRLAASPNACESTSQLTCPSL